MLWVALAIFLFSSRRSITARTSIKVETRAKCPWLRKPFVIRSVIIFNQNEHVKWSTIYEIIKSIKSDVELNYACLKHALAIFDAISCDDFGTLCPFHNIFIRGGSMDLLEMLHSFIVISISIMQKWLSLPLLSRSCSSLSLHLFLGTSSFPLGTPWRPPPTWRAWADRYLPLQPPQACLIQWP